MRYNPLEWPLKNKQSHKIKVGENMEKLQAQCTAEWHSWVVLPKVRRRLLYDPVTPLLGIYPKELKTGTQTDTCMPKFIAVLFTIAKK